MASNSNYHVERESNKLFLVFTLNGHKYKVNVTGCPADFIESIYKAKLKSLEEQK